MHYATLYSQGYTDKLSKYYWHLCKQIPKKDVVQNPLAEEQEEKQKSM